MLLKVIACLAPIIFWTFIYVIPHGSGENYFHFMGWLLSGGISTVSTLVIIYAAIKAKKDIAWWLILLLNLSPATWFFFLI